MTSAFRKLFNKDSLLFSSMVYALGIALSQVVSFIILPIITRAFSVEEYGAFGTYGSIVSLFSTIATLSLGGALFRFGSKCDKNSTEIHRLKTNVLFLVIISSSLIFLGFALFSFFSKNLIILILGVSVVVTSMNTLSQYFLRVQNRALIVLLQSTTYLLVYLISVILINEFNTLSITNVFVSQSLAYCVSFLMGFVFSGHFFKFDLIDKNTIKTLLAFSLPVLGAYLIELLLQYLDIWMLNVLSTQEAVGMFNFIKKYNHVVDFVKTAFFMAWPYFAFKYVKEHLHQSVFNLLIGLIVFVLGLLIVFLNPLTDLLGGEKYIETIPTICVTLCISLLSASCVFLDTSANVSKKNYLITICCLIGIVSDFFLNYLLIPKFGYVGATYATVLSYLIMLVAKVVIYSALKLFKCWKHWTIVLVVLFVASLIAVSLLFDVGLYYIFGLLFIVVGLIIAAFSVRTIFDKKEKRKTND